MEFNPTQVPQTRPKNWLLESILVTIFCCLPLGIVGIVYASQVNGKWNSGDYDGALKSSRQAGTWTKIGFFIGIFLWILNIISIFYFGWNYFTPYRVNNDF